TSFHHLKSRYLPNFDAIYLNSTTPWLNQKKDLIDKAIKGLQDGLYSSARKAGLSCGEISHTAIKANMRARTGQSGGTNKKLSDEQEAALSLYCDRFLYLRTNYKKKYVRLAVNSIIGAACSTGKYKSKQSRSISAARKIAAQEEEIIKRFERFEATMKEYNIDIRNLWNFDETGFRIGIYLVDPENREYATVIEAISAGGKNTEPMVILSGQLVKEKHFKNGQHDDVFMAATESGYNNDRLPLKWLEH
ncbi:hypothetical protein GcM1_133003, partial [Golovinomyces cichoracearum]